MIRFLVLPHHVKGNRFTLSGSEAHHAIHVHRKKVGETLDLFDGRDLAFVGRIDSIDHGQVHGLLLETHAGATIATRLTLYQALIKGPRWDWLLQKASELGVHRVIPLETYRTIVKVDRDASSKLERWHRIALEASKQCGRQDIMAIDAPVTLREALKKSNADHLSLIPWEKEDTTSVQSACRNFKGQTVGLYIGPEGGWDPDEMILAEQVGVMPVRLGPTLLRSETAGLVASTLVFSELGVYS